MQEHLERSVSVVAVWVQETGAPDWVILKPSHLPPRHYSPFMVITFDHHAILRDRVI